MNKWNKTLALAMLSLGCAFAPTFASAEAVYHPYNSNDCNPCAPICDPCNDAFFDVGVEILWWKPCVDDLDYAASLSGALDGGTTGETPFKVKYKSVCPDWEPGFRATIAKKSAWKGFDLSATYFWINSSDTDSTDNGLGESTLPVIGYPGLLTGTSITSLTGAKGKWDTTVQGFDVLFSYPFRCNPCHQITPFFGVEVLWLNQEFEVSYDSVTPIGVEIDDVYTIDWKSDFTGVGLKVGTCYEYTLCDGLSLFAKASGSILTGSTDGKDEQFLVEFTESGIPIPATRREVHYHDDNDSCRLMNEYHLAAGFNYENETCGCEYKLRLGYEFIKWTNVSNPRRFFSDVAPTTVVAAQDLARSTQTNTTTLGFHGLFAGIEIGF
jgi:hypothetical protein